MLPGLRRSGAPARAAPVPEPPRAQWVHSSGGWPRSVHLETVVETLPFVGIYRRGIIVNQGFVSGARFCPSTVVSHPGQDIFPVVLFGRGMELGDGGGTPGTPCILPFDLWRGRLDIKTLPVKIGGDFIFITFVLRRQQSTGQIGTVLQNCTTRWGLIKRSTWDDHQGNHQQRYDFPVETGTVTHGHLGARIFFCQFELEPPTWLVRHVISSKVRPNFQDRPLLAMLAGFKVS